MDWKYVADIMVPIVNCMVIILSAIFGLYKYFRSKNKDYYEKMLTKVYAPMYQFLVRQEIVCSYFETLRSEKFLILTDVFMEKTIENVKNKTDVAGLNHKTFVDIRKDTNIAIAPSSLLLLVNRFETLLSIRDVKDTFNKMPFDEERYEKERIEVENKLIKEVTKGYFKYIMLYKYNLLQRAFYWKKEKENIFGAKSI